MTHGRHAGLATLLQFLQQNVYGLNVIVMVVKQLPRMTRDTKNKSSKFGAKTKA